MSCGRWKCVRKQRHTGGSIRCPPLLKALAKAYTMVAMRTMGVCCVPRQGYKAKNGATGIKRRHLKAGGPLFLLVSSFPANDLAMLCIEGFYSCKVGVESGLTRKSSLRRAYVHLLNYVFLSNLVQYGYRRVAVRSHSHEKL